MIKLKTHKNQIVITTLALLLAVVGYISYDYKTSNFNEENIPVASTEQTVAMYDENQVSDTEAVLNAGGEAVDEVSARFGCRSFAFDPEKGFFFIG